MKTCVKKIDLSATATVTIFDTTRRYYEDYHLVRLEIECKVPLREDYFSGPEKMAEAHRILGDCAVYRRTIEKMGVPYAEIDQAREKLIDSFMANALPYLADEKFPRKFVLSELTKAEEKKRGFA
jgi:hypothetical protein